MTLQGKRVALLESRLGEHLAELVSRQGGLPLRAPALAEIPDTDPQLVAAFLDACAVRPPDLFVFQTGVGTRALFEAARQIGRAEEFLALTERARVAVRGPKPTAVLRGLQVRIDFSTRDPHTTRMLREALDAVALTDAYVVVQRHGESNLDLTRYFEARGAQSFEMPLYRWGMPADTRPLAALLDALAQHALDAVVFTSASQVRNLFEFARGEGREAALHSDLSRTLVVSIGPVCSSALEAMGVPVHAEARPPKLGPLMTLLGDRLQAP